MDNSSLAHTKWNCKYHIVIVTEYRRKVLCGEKREKAVKIPGQLWEWKRIGTIEAGA